MYVQAGGYFRPFFLSLSLFLSLSPSALGDHAWLCVRREVCYRLTDLDWQTQVYRIFENGTEVAYFRNSSRSYATPPYYYQVKSLTFSAPKVISNFASCVRLPRNLESR